MNMGVGYKTTGKMILVLIKGNYVLSVSETMYCCILKGNLYIQLAEARCQGSTKRYKYFKAYHTIHKRTVPEISNKSCK